MTRIRYGMLICFLIFLASCGGGTYTHEPKAMPIFYYTTRYHDDEKGVTCWVYSNGYQGGISCIPDAQLKEGGVNE